MFCECHICNGLQNCYEYQPSTWICAKCTRGCVKEAANKLGGLTMHQIEVYRDNEKFFDSIEGLIEKLK